MKIFIILAVLIAFSVADVTLPCTIQPDALCPPGTNCFGRLLTEGNSTQPVVYKKFEHCDPSKCPAIIYTDEKCSDDTCWECYKYCIEKRKESN